ncbi:ATP-binding cassette domain-containing protein [Microbacterium sp. SLBN-146]|uniref:ATP-binding cassette domain-containing protein n=1 Tax=Microbacterium sp. SLBN-146 TaxID=2768457 RepID=UPI0011540685|nr:ATP-binding cassette domain-containing protein [Microbacterium sp. SLBN-146]TQJ32031.1 ABC transporter family protein [Microbacterium sp. SLBN-146]
MIGVWKRYTDGGLAALESVDLRIGHREIFGVIGESGAGKTTLLDLLAGSITPSAGKLRVLGRSVGELQGRELRGFRRRIGVVFQGVHLLSNRTVLENVRLPLELARKTRPTGATRRAEQDTAHDMLAFVGLADRADHFPAQLSGGQQQRVGIARALAAGPELLLCDEPTSSLDATTADDILRVLVDARDRLGTTVVVVTHDLDVVRAICDRVALFERGRLHDVLTVRSRGGGQDGSYLDRARRALGA